VSNYFYFSLFINILYRFMWTSHYNVHYSCSMQIICDHTHFSTGAKCSVEAKAHQRSSLHWRVEGLGFNFNGLYLRSNGESLLSSWRASITRESPRWLVLKGKLKEAEVVLNRIAEVNGKEMPEDKLQSEPAKQIRMGDLRDLFSSQKMAHKSLLSWYLWCVFIKLL